MKQIFFKTLLLLFITIVFTNCDKNQIEEDYITQQTQTSKISARKIHINQSETLENYVKNNISNNISNINNKDYAITPFGNISLQNITEIIDTNGHTNYTFTITPNQKSTNTFYNLVVYFNPSKKDMASYILEYNMDSPLTKSTNKNLNTLKNKTGTSKKYNTNKLLAFNNKKELKTSFSSQKETSNAPDIESDSQSSVNCNYLGLYITNCNGTNSNKLHKFSTCNGPDKNSSSAKLYYLYDCNSIGGEQVDEYVDPPTCSNCPENPGPESPSGASTGGGNGGTSDLDFPEPIPQYECIETDPITNECVNLVPYYPIIELPENEEIEEDSCGKGYVKDSNGNCVLEIIVDNPDDPITDIPDFLRCFNTAQNATVTVYVNEPNPGSGDTHDGTFVGHTFVSISQGNNISTFGYYPVSNYISPINKSSNSVLGNDGSGNEPFSASISTTINGSQLQQIITLAINNNPTYHLDTYNCTDFAIDIGNLAGMGLPEANGTWPNGGGSNPGTLGMHIRNTNNTNTPTNTNAGNAPATNQGC